jgi:phage terminase small subunit
MRVPNNLNGEAKEFWQRNAKHCVALGTLTDADKDAFTMLCLAYAKMIAIQDDESKVHHWVCISKQVATLLTHFGLTKASRKKLGLEENAITEKDEFDL